MNKIILLLLACTVGLLAKPMSADAQTDYDYQIIDYPGSDFTQVFGINSRGDAVGTGLIGSNCYPFIYDSKKATFTDVTPVAGYDCTAVLGISNSGTLVGHVITDEPYFESGLILDKKGNATFFNHPDAFSFTIARAVNDDGFVTGYIDRDFSVSGEATSGFIYDSATDTFTDIVPSLQTIAQGINADGYVVGRAAFVPGIGPPDPCAGSNAYGRYGWLRAPDGVVTYFDVNGWPTEARGISDSGTIVGWVNVVNKIPSEIKSFVTQLDGTQCQSITIPEHELLAYPWDVTVAQGIRNSGQIVGQVQGELEDGSIDVRGFIATPQ